ncbi:MAG: acyltransferase [Anaerolineae bacterium]|nr:acyltransferase [Phycisphaerae bacterium]
MSTLIGTTPATTRAPRTLDHEAGITDRLQKGHIPALDGVRGLAILLVLFFHFMLITGDGPVIRLIQKTWSFGWMGVDLFFVLSGFLITGILLDAKSKRPTAGSFFKNFYARRTVRIFPLYYAFLVVFLLILPRVMGGFYDLYGRPPTGEWTYWTYTYNLFQGHHQSAREFSHTMGVIWSLCIEEQFYMIWPAIVWFCRPRTLLKICVGLILMSMIARGLVNQYTGYLVFVTQWTFCRMDPLAIGAMIAILTRIAPQRVLAMRKYAIHLLWLIPLVIVGWNAKMGSLVNSKTFLIGGYTALSIMFGSLLLVTITSGGAGPFVWALSNPVLRLFGKLSYAMYLFNQPIKYALLKYVYGFTDPTQEFTSVTAQIGFFVLGTVLTVAAAWISWHVFEKHFLRLKAFFPMDRAAARGGRDPLAASPIAIPQPNAGH